MHIKPRRVRGSFLAVHGGYAWDYGFVLYVYLTLIIPPLDSFGSIEVAELDWGNEDHIRAVVPPFDYIIGTDVVS